MSSDRTALQEQRSTAARLYRRGLSLRAVAVIIGRSHQAVLRALAAEGVELRDQRAAHRLTRRSMASTQRARLAQRLRAAGKTFPAVAEAVGVSTTMAKAYWNRPDNPYRTPEA